MAQSIYKYFHLISLVLLIFNCTSPKIFTLNPIDDQILMDKYTELLNNQYPDSFALTQRIILNVSGKQYDFIGQLTINRGIAFRAVAFGEMGGQFIDILAKNDTVSILANPTGLPEKPILQGVTEDIIQLFHYKKPNSFRLSYPDIDTNSVVLNESSTIRHHYSVSRNKNQILSLESYSKNKSIRLAEFLEYKKYDIWDREIPLLIYLTNKRWRYSLEIHLLKFSNHYDSQKVFH